MSPRALLVLRGRPGLGHLIPGLAIGRELVQRGWLVRYVSYADGAAFLRRSGITGAEEIRLPKDHEDWPGLTLYDHGLRFVVPCVERFGADLLVLGGEYLLGLLGEILDLPCVMLFNPEILEVNPRNQVAARLFARLFAGCSHLIPLREADPDNCLDEFRPLLDRLLPAGPFVPILGGMARSRSGAGFSVVIANGGGVSFPRRTDSYSDEGVDPRHWHAETKTMTKASAEGALAACRRSQLVFLFSCLGSRWNETLERELGRPPNLAVHGPSMDYYARLPSAGVLVSRAGAGFLADARASSAEIVLWSLGGHTEQRANAEWLCRTRPRTRLATDPEHLHKQVVAAVEAAQRDPPPPAIEEVLANRTRKVAEALAGLPPRQRGEA